MTSTEKKAGEETLEIGASNAINIGGRIKQFFHQWQDITSDPEILEIIKGVHIEFLEDKPPCQVRPPGPIKMTQEEASILDAEISKLIQKGVIEETTHSDR